MTESRLARIQNTLKLLGLPAWLLYNFRDSNPVALRVAEIPAGTHQTRRWALLIPAEGQPRALTHRIEPHLQEFLPGHRFTYASHDEFRAGLHDLCNGIETVAMEYSPDCAIPVVAKVDGGTIELVRSGGVTVVSSGDLIAHIEAQLSQAQIESCARAGQAVRGVMMDAFAFIRESILGEQTITEYDVQQKIVSLFVERSMVTDHPPIVAVNAHSADPHYQPSATSSSVIKRNDFVLIDLWAHEDSADGIFGDITWTGFVGESVPEKYVSVFNIVRDARDAAFRLVSDAFLGGRDITGAELDDAARNVIVAAGHGINFTHRTGHSITSELHGAGANLDNYETHDTRHIIKGTSFSIEPGIYLTDDFGVRSELDVLIDLQGNVTATSQPIQSEVLAILA